MKKSKTIILKNVRGAWLHLIEPNARFEPHKYSITILIPKDDPQLNALSQASQEVAKLRFPNITTAQYKELRKPWNDGDTKDMDGYDGNFYINAKSDVKPAIVNQYGEAPSDKELADLCFPGCYFNVSINVSAYDVAGNKGIGCYVRAVQLQRAGEPLGGSNPMYDFADTIAQKPPETSFDANDFDADLEDSIDSFTNVPRRSSPRRSGPEGSPSGDGARDAVNREMDTLDENLDENL